MDNAGRVTQAEYHAALDRRSRREAACQERIAELELALKAAQAAIAKCLSEGGRLDGGPDADWWPGIVAAQQKIAATLKE